MTPAPFTGGWWWENDGFEMQVKRLHEEPIHPGLSSAWVVNQLQQESQKHTCVITRYNCNACKRPSPGAEIPGRFYTLEFGTRTMAMYACWQLNRSRTFHTSATPFTRRQASNPVDGCTTTIPGARGTSRFGSRLARERASPERSLSLGALVS